jgi:hypothetical protein
MIPKLRHYYQVLQEIAEDIKNIRIGYRFFKQKRTTPNEAAQSIIRLFCRTRGLSNNIIHWFIKAKANSNPIFPIQGNLFFQNKSALKAVAKQIRKESFFVFKNGLTTEQIAYLHRFSTSNPARLRNLVDDPSQRQPVIETIDLQAPKVIRYDFTENQIINDPVVQSLVTDTSLISLARTYLGCEPVLATTAMWWHTDFEKIPNPEAATMWHFDMDYVRWLNFFFYLTDVDSNSGPHCVVKGTHKWNAIPRNLLRRGYARITDAEIADNFPAEKVVEFTGNAGTLIIEDTRALHKGKHVLSGSRLLLQITFAVDTFGANYPSVSLANFANSEIEKIFKSNPRRYAKYLKG